MCPSGGCSPFFRARRSEAGREGVPGILGSGEVEDGSCVGEELLRLVEEVVGDEVRCFDQLWALLRLFFF